MRKLKIYLDTSVISHLFAEDTPEKMKETLDFWEDVKSGKYEVITSAVTIREISEASMPKRLKMLKALNEVEHTVIALNPSVERLAEEIIEKGILTRKSFDDCQHIATAILEGCSIIVSWNFKHIVRKKTIKGVREITISKEYQSVDIYSPVMMLDEEE